MRHIRGDSDRNGVVHAPMCCTFLLPPASRAPLPSAAAAAAATTTPPTHARRLQRQSAHSVRAFHPSHDLY
ncbi:hypothetical protein EON67_00810 [archaeon]|nr:MAG: hypothetical protein EON67_00810 [archaeon]